MNFGERVRALREQKGMSQGDLAEKVAVARTMVNRIESGVRVPPLMVAVAIADTLNTTVDYLVKGDA